MTSRIFTTATVPVCIALLGLTPAFAADIFLHVDNDCKGPSLATTISDQDVNYPVSSVKASSGDWEICRDTDYRNCIAVETTGCTNLEDIRFWGQVRSVRLVEKVDEGATIYRDVGYTGPAVYIGKERRDLTDMFPISSIRIKSTPWELCPEKNFRGKCRTATGDTSNLKLIGVMWQVKSMRPAKAETAPSGEAAFHVRASCSGPSTSTTRAIADMNYPVRSVRVFSGEWEFCSRGNYQGSCQRVSSGCTDVRSVGFWGQVRSVRPVAAEIPKPQPR